ncbi:MAG: hypothetical protein M3R27_08675 [Bacteroidota bacterium]|nr:hypothetical protein [Bacteroidota bacterium]
MKTTLKSILLIVIGMFITGIAAAGILPDVPAPKKVVKEFSLTAPTEDPIKCFDESTKLINLGVGFGGVGYYKGRKGSGYSYGRTPAFSLSYEQAIPKKVGPGYIGVGVYFGYQNAHQRYEDVYYAGNRYYYEHNWNYMMIAARGAYHFDFLNSERAEVYAGAIIGVRIQTYSYSTNSPDPDDNYKLNEGAVYPAYSLFAGARWYFVKRVAFFAEAGYGISFLTGGLTFKF